ncbi:CARDB domain-containing protein [Paludisphaera mucosa]|uniref:CARDB domain-containing protein n=1 Tax=Paludisphaera mucosa TaxID=3030827 RepID=A0ABT6FDM5_9BACT|nr:CARDB domain-containing protein [Paludisphaera mucosa]MDG3005675.1 CARDB domain-containing protein [Paludisphaera mucosa]
MSDKRRSEGRRRAWGRGPIILRFDSLEKREVLSATGQALPDLVGSSLVMVQDADWGDTVTATGQITNQGDGNAAGPFNVAIYAGSRSTIGRYSVYLGEVTIPNGLAAGQSIPFTTDVKLPANPVPGLGTSGLLQVGLKVDSQKQVAESNERNDSGIGPGYDQAIIQIAPSQPAQLIAASVGVYPGTATWGNNLAVTSQITNKSYGAAPATRAQIVLTPAGIAQGTGSDVTIGSINVPTIQPWQTVNVEKSIALPAIPPVLLAGYSQFTITILPDADFLTNPVGPHYAIGGTGIDQAAVGISLPADVATTPIQTNLPDLAVGTVAPSTGDLVWGGNFDVSTTVQNMGTVDPGPFRVRFMLVGPSGNTTRTIFLSDVIVPGLAPGYVQAISQTVSLPSRLPSGILLDGIGTAKIVAIADPENGLNETFKNNNTATSAPVSLRLLGSDGTTFVPNTPAPEVLLTVNRPSMAKYQKAQKLAQAAAATQNGQAAPSKKLFRRPPPKTSSNQSLNVFPKSVTNFFDNLF